MCADGIGTAQDNKQAINVASFLVARTNHIRFGSTVKRNVDWVGANIPLHNNFKFNAFILKSPCVRVMFL
jgi:hypothetical protein